MKVVLGIGNPGSRYESTKHNIGFMLLDQFAAQRNLKFTASRHDYWYAEGKLDGSDYVLIKPTTYVNLSGNAAKDSVEEYGISPEELLVVCDDINLEPGSFRVRPSGGDGGHNGMSSIIYQLGTDQFPRLRLGIGRNFKQGEMADYVLSRFSPRETELIAPVFKVAGILVEEYIRGGIKKMLDLNSNLKNNDLNN